MKRDDFEAQVQAMIERNNPIYHIPVELGIKEFKRQVKLSGAPKSIANQLIKRYKKRGWAEFNSIARGRGSFPTKRVDTTTKIKVDFTTETTKLRVTHER